MDHRDDWPDGILEGDLDAADAERIARDARNMNAVLSAMAGRVGERLPTPIHGKAAPAPRRRSRSWRTVAPLAAAAAIAALIFVRGGEIGDYGEPLVPPPASRAPSMVSEMDVEADRPFVVFPTNDPDIAVVWLFNSEESD